MNLEIQDMVNDILEATEWTGSDSYIHRIEERAAEAQMDAWCAYAGEGVSPSIVNAAGQAAYDQVYNAGIVRLYENWARYVLLEKYEALAKDSIADAQAVVLDEYNARGIQETHTFNIIGAVLFFVVIACLLFAVGSFIDKAWNVPSWAVATHEPLIWKWMGPPP